MYVVEVRQQIQKYSLEPLRLYLKIGQRVLGWLVFVLLSVRSTIPGTLAHLPVSQIHKLLLPVTEVLLPMLPVMQLLLLGHKLGMDLLGSPSILLHKIPLQESVLMPVILDILGIVEVRFVHKIPTRFLEHSGPTPRDKVFQFVEQT